MSNTLAHLNSSIIAFAPRVFYSIHVMEALICTSALILTPFAAIAIMRADVIHRNFRLFVMGTALRFPFAALARAVILYHEKTDRIGPSFCLNLAVIFRCEFIGYYCLVMFGIAFERMIALQFSEWYESGSNSTIIVFVLAELLALIPALAVAVMWTLKIVSHYMIFACLVGFIIISITTIALNYLLNLRKLRRLGVSYTNYTLGRTFQIRENIRTLMFLIRFFFIISIFGTIGFTLYLLYEFLPDEFSEIRYISIALFDFWVSIQAFSTIFLLVSSEQLFFREFIRIKMISSIRKRLKFEDSEALPTPDANFLGTALKKVSAADVYFVRLNKSWS